MDDKIAPADSASAALVSGRPVAEQAEVHGRFDVVCVGPDGVEKWRDVIDNVVCTAGKDLAFDTFLAGAAYTVVGPFMGLISSVTFSAVNAADTMTSHAGWLEAGGANAPTYTAPRKTCAWAAASGGSKALSAALAFVFSGAGTVEGCFLVYGAGAVSTIDNTAGTLWSAGTFAGGPRAVLNLDQINVSYSVSM